MKGLFKLLAKDRKRPLDHEPKMETRQMNLKEFNTIDFNNTKIVKDLDVNHITLGRGGSNDEE